MTRPVRRVLRAVGYIAVGMALGLIAAFVIHLNSRPDLQVWHLAELDEEFTADAGIADFEAYLALEERVFRQVDERVYSAVPPNRGGVINRYSRGSLSDPLGWPRNWNRSYVLPAASPKAAVLMLHGMSDSPYSLRDLGQRLNEAGAYVVGLRMPGHGTAPSGLVELTRQDMASAVSLAVQHLARQADGRPLYVVGYSTGSALAVHYVLTTLDDDRLPRVNRVVMLSPAIGVSPAAGLAVWQARLGHLLGLDKLAWNDIQPEYDPFKYASFAVNAGDVVFRLTSEIQRRLTELAEQGRLDAVPPILAFSSVVDATVSVPALVEGLFARLPAGGHELVLFDINRRAGVESILTWQPDEAIEALRRDAERPYRLSVVSNAGPDERSVVLRSSAEGQLGTDETALGLSWPDGVYSLAHVALPFPPTDPPYGIEPDAGGTGIHLGNLALRGEKGVLQVSAIDMLRLRSNPFYPFVLGYTLAFLGLGS